MLRCNGRKSSVPTWKSVQDICSDANLKIVLNLKGLSAGDPLSLTEELSLLTPSLHFSYRYLL